VLRQQQNACPRRMLRVCAATNVRATTGFKKRLVAGIRGEDVASTWCSPAHSESNPAVSAAFFPQHSTKINLDRLLVGVKKQDYFSQKIGNAFPTAWEIPPGTVCTGPCARSS
jgi:hypothetical protein